MSDLSPIERQLLRKAAFDNEFMMEVAAQNNYTGADDMADVARYHGFQDLDGTRNLTLGGFYAPPSEGRPVGTIEEPYWGRIAGVNYFDSQIPVEVGTVNAVHNKANPQIWAHEFRHRDFPSNGEGTTRMLDFATALDQKQQDEAVRMLNEKANRGKKPENRSTNSETLVAALKQMDGPFGRWGGMPYRDMLAKEWNRGARSTPLGKAEDIDDYVDQRHDSAFFQKTFAEMDEYLDWNKGLSKRNLQRKMNALPVSTPMERQFAKQERRRLLRDYDKTL